MTETTDTTPPAAPPLLLSIGQILGGLAQHAGAHGHEEGAAGEPIDKVDAPECLVGHIAEISEVLFSVADPKNHGARVVLPRDMPEGLVERLQQLAHDEIAKMERRA